MASSPTSTRTPEPTHGCLRCGIQVPLDVALCEYCNPLGLPQPAASQVHGSVFVAIVVAIAGLAILGRFALAGIGPFSGRILDVGAAGSSLSVTFAVTNEGSASGSATCRVYDPAQGSGVGPADAYVTSPRIPAGETATFSETVTELGGQVRPLAVVCTGP